MIEHMSSKYNSEYSKDYACLWAYGNETLGLNGTEQIYKRITDLALNILNTSYMNLKPYVIDIGCGTGRTIRDLAIDRPDGTYLGVDESAAMLKLAKQILCGTELIQFSPKHRGFNTCTLRGSGLRNVHLLGVKEYLQALNHHQLEANLCISMNVIERAQDVDSYLDLARRALSSQGHLILASSMNWLSARNWERFRDFSLLVDYVCNKYGFCQLSENEEFNYFEQTDVRGSGEKYIVNIGIVQRV